MNCNTTTNCFNQTQKSFIQWKEHDNTKYLYLNFDGLDSLEVLRSFKTIKNIILNQPNNSVNILGDLNHLDFSFNTHATARIVGREVQHKIRKSAILGITNQNLALFKIYQVSTNSRAKTFDSYMDAINYICSNE